MEFDTIRHLFLEILYSFNFVTIQSSGFLFTTPTSPSLVWRSSILVPQRFTFGPHPPSLLLPLSPSCSLLNPRTHCPQPLSPLPAFAPVTHGACLRSGSSDTASEVKGCRQKSPRETLMEAAPEGPGAPRKRDSKQARPQPFPRGLWVWNGPSESSCDKPGSPALVPLQWQVTLDVRPCGGGERCTG